ncbi:hypothetical protein SK355_12310 [Candidatus Fukatsuia symbiotica]|uniref:Uncharacterized protein n=1 Tax=Candidatus Fukatsuia symbiotica TaxID=1878942 RepID=A0A2U8I3T1_9GAMM|nr:hypothetical protein [Candidatus Fukatsuia symbiotica]AWK13768.1 hypothetical protein CCS41_03605 [Candidatus Fukatsuia symbiotica]MEA9445952.1 hypothetical protein [Candidatus Fukatsuia symbiotica]
MRQHPHLISNAQITADTAKSYAKIAEECKQFAGIPKAISSSYDPATEVEKHASNASDAAHTAQSYAEKAGIAEGAAKTATETGDAIKAEKAEQEAKQAELKTEKHLSIAKLEQDKALEISGYKVPNSDNRITEAQKEAQASTISQYTHPMAAHYATTSAQVQNNTTLLEKMAQDAETQSRIEDEELKIALGMLNKS